VIHARENDNSWRAVAAETGVNRSTARRVWERRERYLQMTDTVSIPRE